MFSSVILYLASFLLAGASCYAIFVSPGLRAQSQVKQMLTGLIFGVLVVFLNLSAIAWTEGGAPVDGSAGPLLFAGYLGGPIGAVLATLLSCTYQIGLEGPVVTTSIFAYSTSAAAGVLIRYLMPPRTWQQVPRRAAAALAVGFLAIHALAFQFLDAFNTAELAGDRTAVNLIAPLIVGVISILMTWLMLALAHRCATQVIQSGQVSKRLNRFLQDSEMGMLDYDLSSDTFWCNLGLVSMYGLGEGPITISKQDWLARIHPDDQVLVQKTLDELLHGVKHHDQTEMRATWPDGRTIHVRTNWTVERDNNGTPLNIIGLQGAVTKSHKTNDKQLESMRSLALIIDSLPGAVMQRDMGVDGRSRLRYVSPNCKLIWGYTDKELYTDPNLLSEAHDPDDLPVFKGKVNMSSLTGDPVSHRFQVTTRDGGRKWVDFHGGGSSPDGTWGRFEGIFLDVTSEVEAQEHAARDRELAYRAQKNESIGHLTGGVAHDFNNLLAVTLGSLELLQDEKDPSAQRDLIGQAIKATLRGADLTKSMLAFARQAELDPEILAANEVVHEAQSWIVRTLPESVSVETSLFAGLWHIKADRSSLESALLNLIINARDAMKGQGCLTIETANVRMNESYIDARQEELPPGRYVMLAVTDTGTGISKANLATIFDPFFTTKAPGDGTGLGLSMVVGFMRQSGGTVQVYSEIGKGTTFKLYFPAAAVEAEKPEPKSTHSLPHNAEGKRVLVVEDEDAVRDVLEIMLSRAGYQVVKAVSGDDALVIFATDPAFDLLITDIVMPGELQGAALCHEIRKHRPDLPVVFMSGYASEATVHSNGLRAEDIRMMKPIQRADLLATVAKAIAIGSS